MDPLITHLCERARRNDPRLRHVSLRSLPLLEVTNEEMVAVVESLENNTHVSTFDMSIQYQDNDDDEDENNAADEMNAVAEEAVAIDVNGVNGRIIDLHEMVAVNALDLNENGNDNDAAITIDQSFLPPPPPPFELIFSRNTSLVDVRISSPSSFILASVFRGLALNGSVQILQVGEMSANADTTSMDTACSLELKQMLERNRSIHRLALQGFHWDEPRALQAVASGLRANKALRVLELLQIVTTTASTAVIANSVAGISSQLCVGEEFPTDLMSAISTMKKLKRLSIIACEMSDMSFAVDDHVIVEKSNTLNKSCDLNMDVDIPLITSIPATTKACCSDLMKDALQRDDRPQLEELRLVECDLTGPAIHSLQRGWKHNPFLRILDVRGNSLEDDSCRAIAQILNTVTSLTKVILEDNNIGDDGLTILSQHGLSQNKTLRQLCLKENNFGSSGVQALADAIQRNQCLEELDLSYNAVCDAGATALGTMLAVNSALQDLVLESTTLGGIGVMGLCSGLRSNGSLHKLNLSGNAFGATGIQALTILLAPGDESPCCLKSLRLSSCQLSDGGVAAIATALEQNTCLEEIVLPFNRFGDEGANAIGQSLPKWKGLVSLQIQFNLFSEAGFENIVKGLSKNFYLKSMYLLNAGPSNRRIDKLFQEMQHWIRLNKAGRRVLDEKKGLPPVLWPLVLTKASKAYNTDALFFLLRESPDIAASVAKSLTK